MRQSGRKGFSLVEVTLSIGVIAFSLLSLIGLLPTGLSALRDSMDQTVHAQILQRVSADLAGADSASLQDQTCYYDENGQFLGQSESVPSSARYTVRLAEEDPSLPGLTGTDEITVFASHLKRYRIGITRSHIPNAVVEWYAIQLANR